MMDACKSFESYLVQQVMKQVKEAVAKSEDDQGEYMSYFGDMLYEKYAEDITESGELGIAQQLYESMKRNK
jgi:flagellar protein FlgJ